MKMRCLTSRSGSRQRAHDAVVLRDYDANVEGRGRLMELARTTLRRDYGLQRGDAMVLTAGIDWPRGGTNTLRVLIEEYEGKRVKFSSTVSL